MHFPNYVCNNNNPIKNQQNCIMNHLYVYQVYNYYNLITKTLEKNNYKIWWKKLEIMTIQLY